MTAARGARGTPRTSRRRHAQHPVYAMLTVCGVQKRSLAAETRTFAQVPAADQCAACRRRLRGEDQR